MQNQTVDCQKCGCSNKLGAIFCRNCGTKLKFNKSLLDTPKKKQVRKVLKRALNALITILIVGVIGMAFCPLGFPKVEKISDEVKITELQKICEDIDSTIDRKAGNLKYSLTAPEATFVANYLANEHEKKRVSKSEGLGSSSGGLGGVGKMGEKTELGGTGKMGEKSDLGGVSKMEFENTPDPPPSEEAAPQSDKARRRALREESKARAEQEAKAKVPTFDFIITIKDTKTLSVVLKEKWFHFIPCRLELLIVPELIENEKDATKKLTFKIVSARFGYLPLPLYFKDQIVDLFKELMLTERKWAIKYFKNLKDVEIKSDEIEISISE